MALSLLISVVAVASVSGIKAPVLRGTSSEQLLLTARNGRGSVVNGQNVSAFQKVSAEESHLVNQLLTDARVSWSSIVTRGIHSMSDDEAFRRVDTLDLSPEVSSLVRLARSRKSTTLQGPLDEADLARSRKILNAMIYNSVVKMDDKIIECKEFQERNRAFLKQVNNDLTRLGFQIAQYEKGKGVCNNGIQEADSSRDKLEGELDQLDQGYKAVHAANTVQLTKLQKELTNYTQILKMVKCRDDSFMQFDSEPVRICDEGGDFELRFGSLNSQSRFESMAPSARTWLRKVLLVAHGVSLSHESRQTLSLANDSVLEAQWQNCTTEKPNCGTWHDEWSQQWGKKKDVIDQLQDTMNKNSADYKKDKANLKAQLVTYTTKKSEQMLGLGDLTAKATADRGESDAKSEQHRSLEHEYKQTMMECKDTISKLLFTDICAVKKVRNEIMSFSSVTPPSDILDCDVKDWVPGSCSMACDDQCPLPDPFACGGWQTLSRQVVVSPNEYGVQCPPLSRKKKCNQFKCPVSCSLSVWTSWSKCSKECEGGVQSKTRAVLAEPRNGGQGCDTIEESRPCNSGSCDRDCTLRPWTEWGPCSMPCGGGSQTRTRSVLVAVRGGGKCPSDQNAERVEAMKCNAHDCHGDEVCRAKQDLIIALDGSGSLKESCFGILREFTARLVQRYDMSFKCSPQMHLGVVLFGNGHQLSDGSISPAISVEGLTNDTVTVTQSIRAAKWQRGFTNLAQAFVLAGTMFQSESRQDAQNAVLVIWDGSYSLAFQTAQRAKDLKDKGVQLYMAAVSVDIRATEVDNLKKWVSHPWETHFQRIPGIEAIKENMDQFTQKLIVKFCSNSYSPALSKQVDNSRMFLMLREMARPDEGCATLLEIGTFTSVVECADAARKADKSGFSYRSRGAAQTRGLCEAAEAPFTVTPELYQQWKAGSVSQCIQCPGGSFVTDQEYDFYVLDPL